MKALFNKLKTFIDAWKIWLFFTAILFGTNGAQMYANSEPQTEELTLQRQTPTEKPTIIKQIIYKPDNSYCDKKLNDHENGELH